MTRSIVVAALAALALAGCKKASKPGPAKLIDAVAALDAAPPPPDAPDVEGDLTPGVPAGKPGVQVKGLEYEGHEAKLLPAIRDDGRQFAAVVIGDDGGRGYLDLRLRVLDAATGKLVEDRVLADPEETSKAQDEDGTIAPALLATVRSRVADANTLLGQATWRPLESFDADPADAEQPIVAAGIEWYLGDGLHLLGKRHGKIVFDKTYQQLTGKAHPKAGGDDDMCPDVIALDALHLDAKTGTALVAFGRQPGHNCGAPGADLAVIALPK